MSRAQPPRQGTAADPHWNKHTSGLHTSQCSLKTVSKRASRHWCSFLPSFLPSQLVPRQPFPSLPPAGCCLSSAAASRLPAPPEALAELFPLKFNFLAPQGARYNSDRGEQAPLPKPATLLKRQFNARFVFKLGEPNRGEGTCTGIIPLASHQEGN